MSPRATISRRGADRIRAGHPWIYRSDVTAVDAEPGDLVRVVAERGREVGWAWFSAESQITLRLLATTGGPIDLGALVGERIAAAALARQSMGIDATAWRLVHAESDLLPATIVDRYAESEQESPCFVVQTLAQGPDRHRQLLVDALVRQFQPRGILARHDVRVRALEGLPLDVSELYGEVPDRLTVRQGSVRVEVDLRGGQKTGLFLDQRENHDAAARYAAGEALDAFSYQGGFALALARRARAVLAVDVSAAALAATLANARVNGFDNIEVREANAFDHLRELEVEGRRFDTVVLDPPAFAKNRAAVPRALAGYKEINLRALRLLRPGGHLITCSCSYNVDEPTFLDVVRAAASDAGAPVWLVEKRVQARDHPVLLGVPETAYLKCLILRRIG